MLTDEGRDRTKARPMVWMALNSVAAPCLRREGAFGVLTHVTLKVFRHMPETIRRFSYMFKNWQTAQAAARESCKARRATLRCFVFQTRRKPASCYTYTALSTAPAAPVQRKGFKEDEMCRYLGFTNGEKGFSRNCACNVKRVAKKYDGFGLTGVVTKAWEKGRFSDPYLRDTMQDFGMVMDTMECTVNWSNMAQVHRDVRAFVKSRPGTICMTHISHAYSQGANLYWIFITMESDPEGFKAFHAGILDAIQKSDASMSHHHGIGKMFGPWLEGSLGRDEYDIFRALKQRFDPDNIMNPGGTLGLDIPEEEKRFLPEDIR